MALIVSLLLMATVATSALHSFGQYRCSQADIIRGPGAFEGKPCGIATIPPTLTSPPSVQNLQGGYPSVAHSWPWVVSIQYRDFVAGTNWHHICPGTLVSSRLVITNGYCQHAGIYSSLGAQTPFNWLVVLGPYATSVFSNINTSVTANGPWIRSKIKLSKDAIDSSFINNICVGKVEFPIGYADCFVVGWYNDETALEGRDLIGNPNMTQAQVKIISMDEYNRATGQKGDPNNDIATVVISPGGFPAWRSLGQPLMCRYWCSEGTGQWHLVGVADGYAIKKGLSNAKTYALFYKYTPE